MISKKYIGCVRYFCIFWGSSTTTSPDTLYDLTHRWAIAVLTEGDAGVDFELQKLLTISYFFGEILILYQIPRKSSFFGVFSGFWGDFCIKFIIYGKFWSSIRPRGTVHQGKSRIEHVESEPSVACESIHNVIY